MSERIHKTVCIALSVAYVALCAAHYTTAADNMFAWVALLCAGTGVVRYIKVCFFKGHA